MIAHFPVALFVPGLLFIVLGLFYRAKANDTDPDNTAGKYVEQSARITGNIAILFGALMLAVAVPVALLLRTVI